MNTKLDLKVADIIADKATFNHHLGDWLADLDPDTFRIMVEDCSNAHYHIEMELANDTGEDAAGAVLDRLNLFQTRGDALFSFVYQHIMDSVKALAESDPLPLMLVEEGDLEAYKRARAAS